MTNRNIIIAGGLGVLTVGFLVFIYTNQAELAEQPSQDQTAITTVPTNTLQSTPWVWKETIMNDGTRITPRQTDAFVLTFDSEGRVSGQTDCNGFGGEYTVTDGVLAMGPFIMTMMYCDGSQEMEFQGMLDEPVTYMLTETGDLVLMLPYDSGSVIFAPKV